MTRSRLSTIQPKVVFFAVLANSLMYTTKPAVKQKPPQRRTARSQVDGVSGAAGGGRKAAISAPATARPKMIQLTAGS